MKKGIYIVINWAVLLAAAALFVLQYGSCARYHLPENAWGLLCFAGGVLVVHLIKAGRLYLAFYGTPMKGTDYIKTYCKVTPVSMLLPYKLGEIFRIYCYGYLINDFMRGTVVVMLDRFMDTLALVSVILLLCAVYTSHVTPLVYALLAFLLCLVMLYYVFPGVYRFWKQYYLHAPASKYTLWWLEQLELLHNLYEEIEVVVKGRGLILYFLSLLAWGMELLVLVVFSQQVFSKQISQKISDYLFAALNGNPSLELNQFIIVSAILLVGCYLLLQLLKGIKKQRYLNENHYSV